MRTDETFAVGDLARLDVDIPAGSIRVQNGAPGKVSVSIDAADPDIVEVSHLGDAVTIRHAGRWLGRGRPIRAFIEVPPGSEITVVTASADVRLLGEFGPSRVRTASGDIEVERAERADLDAASGDLRVRSVPGNLAVSTASGDVTVGSVGGRLAASLTSGTLRVDLVDGPLEVTTTSGDVAVRRCNGDDITVKSVSGDVALGLPTGIRVDPDIHTLSGRTVLPRPAGSGSGGNDRRRVRLRIHTISGDIRIDRA